MHKNRRQSICTDVAAQSRATNKSSPGKHVPDADTNVSDSESGTLVSSSNSTVTQTAPTVNENYNVAMSSGTSERAIPLAQETTQIPNGFTPYGTRTAQTPQTVREASITPESTKQTIDSRTAQGKYNYMPVSNDEATQRADAAIREKRLYARLCRMDKRCPRS